jgi:integrase
MLRIDQQWKGTYYAEPKWGLARTIPLPKIAIKTLRSVTPEFDGSYFPKTTGWVQIEFPKLRAALSAADPERRQTWDSLTPHVLRRSLNTNLIMAGVNARAIAEYLSWRHQDDSIMSMQERYLKVRLSHLQVVADAIDDMLKSNDNIIGFSAK